MRKNQIISLMLSSLVLVVGGLTMATGFTAVTYAKSCSKLTGFPGLLQSIGIVTAGPCVSKIGGTTCGGGNACTTLTAVAGTCKNIAAAGQAANCACMPNNISPTSTLK
jgi:hypothetical protein